METLKKIYAFIVCIVWAFATIGSTAYLFYHHLPQFAVANNQEKSVDITEYEPTPPVEYRQKPHKDMPRDTSEVDTTRIPIAFNPSVEDWDDIEENL